MNLKKFVFILFLLSVLICLYVFTSPKKQSVENTLVVYTYSSFASSWGAGAYLKEAFQKQSGYAVDFVDVGDAGTILQRLDLEKQKTQADVILGLDQFSLDKAQKQFEFLDHNIKYPVHSKVDLGKSDIFLPIDWAPMVFVYRVSDLKGNLKGSRTGDLKELPKKLDDLISSKYKSKFVLYDPASSTPGYIFINYIFDLMGETEGKKFIKKLKQNALTMTPSWSAGYGLFTQKNVQLAFSYATSPVYHWAEEKNYDYQGLILKEPAPVHIEYTAILKQTLRPKIAKEFLNFLISDEAQKIIMTKNYMLPVIESMSENEKESIEKGTSFEDLKLPELHSDSGSLKRDQVLEYWSDVK